MTIGEKIALRRRTAGLSQEALAAQLGGGTRVLAEEPYYRHIPRDGLKLSTRVSMDLSDRFRMVKMIRLHPQ